MSEIDTPADAPIAATELAATEVRRPRLLRLTPDMLREMADRTAQSRERRGRDSRQSKQFWFATIFATQLDGTRRNGAVQQRDR